MIEKLDLHSHLLRQMAFSHSTYGPGARTLGVLEHIRKEIEEVKKAENSVERAKEWTDLVILALDGLTRELAYMDGKLRADPQVVASLALRYIVEKQSKNEGRAWPDWRTVAAGKAIEHDRSKDEGQTAFNNVDVGQLHGGRATTSSRRKKK